MTETENKYLSVSENGVDLIFSTDTAGHVVYANDAALNFWGYSFNEMAGKSYMVLVHPDHRKKLISFYSKQLRTKKKTTYIEYPLNTKGGRVKWVGQNGAIIYEGDRITGFRYTCRDITNRIQAENAGSAFASLGERLSSARTINEAALIIVDTADTLIGWEACSFDLYSQQYDRVKPVLMVDTVGGVREDFSHNAAEKKPSAAARRVLDEGPLLYINSQSQLTHSSFNAFGDIGRKSASIIMVPVRHKGSNIGVISIHSYKENAFDAGDLNTLTALADHCAGAIERIRIEEELRVSERRYKDIFDYANMGIFQVTPEGKLLTINAAISEILGYSNTNELIASNFFETVFHDRTKLKEMLFDLEKLKYKEDYELLWKTKEGKLIWVQLSMHAVKNILGKLLYFEGFAKDITDKKITEAKLLESLKEKEVLLKEIHHRVKNNLQVISSLLNLQARSIESNEIKEIFRESQNRVKSMALIHEKLYQSTEFVNINFAEYIKSLTDYLIRTYSVDREKIAIDLSVKDISLGIDYAIPCGIIINELLSNAIKYAFTDKKAGVIKIVFLRRGKEYTLQVADNGRGLPGEFNIHNTGTLGLQLVQTLTQQLNGVFSYDTNGGTTFTVKFKDAA